MSKKSRSVLWVGNSWFFYNNGIHHHVRELVRGAAHVNVDYRGCLITISGSGLDWHDFGSYFRPQGLGRYSFDANNEVVINEPALRYDTVVMMDSSQGPLHPKLQPDFDRTVAANCKTAALNGAEPVLFMSWAYKNRPEMTALLSSQYLHAGVANRAAVIPAALAFAGAQMRLPDVELYQADNAHPSLAGTYLASCTAFATLYSGHAKRSSYSAGLNQRTAEGLQDIALEAVEELRSASIIPHAGAT